MFGIVLGFFSFPSNRAMDWEASKPVNHSYHLQLARLSAKGVRMFRMFNTKKNPLISKEKWYEHGISETLQLFSILVEFQENALLF